MCSLLAVSGFGERSLRSGDYVFWLGGLALLGPV